jgi:hypothetical protein
MLIMGGKVSCLIMKLYKASNLLFLDARGNRCEINTKYFTDMGGLRLEKLVVLMETIVLLLANETIVLLLAN